MGRANIRAFPAPCRARARIARRCPARRLDAPDHLDDVENVENIAIVDAPAPSTAFPARFPPPGEGRGRAPWRARAREIVCTNCRGGAGRFQKTRYLRRVHSVRAPLARAAAHAMSDFPGSGARCGRSFHWRGRGAADGAVPWIS
jgi:hypothetical protein